MRFAPGPTFAVLVLFVMVLAVSSAAPTTTHPVPGGSVKPIKAIGKIHAGTSATFIAFTSTRPELRPALPVN